MLRRLLAAAAVLLALPSAAHAQPFGPTLTSFRFQGCDLYLCADVRFSTHPPIGPIAPYLLTVAGSVTARPAFLALPSAGGALFASFFVKPGQSDDGMDWDGGADVFGLVSAASPTLTFGPQSAGPIDALNLQSAQVTYALDPSTGTFDSVLNLTPVTSTPEPATLALVGGGLIALGGVARRRRRPA